MVTLFTLAMNKAATASYRAVPSILIVAPTGMTNVLTRGSTWLFTSKQWRVTGMVAELKKKKKKKWVGYNEGCFNLVPNKFHVLASPGK